MIRAISNALSALFPRRGTARVDRLPFADTQRDTLLRLLKLARKARFGRAFASLRRFVENPDETLAGSNEDYASHRSGDLTRQTPAFLPIGSPP